MGLVREPTRDAELVGRRDALCEFRNPFLQRSATML